MSKSRNLSIYIQSTFWEALHKFNNDFRPSRVPRYLSEGRLNWINIESSNELMNFILTEWSYTVFLYQKRNFNICRLDSTQKSWDFICQVSVTRVSLDILHVQETYFLLFFFQITISHHKFPKTLDCIIYVLNITQNFTEFNHEKLRFRLVSNVKITWKRRWILSIRILLTKYSGKCP